MFRKNNLSVRSATYQFDDAMHRACQAYRNHVSQHNAEQCQACQRVTLHCPSRLAREVWLQHTAAWVRAVGTRQAMGGKRPNDVGEPQPLCCYSSPNWAVAVRPQPGPFLLLEWLPACLCQCV